MGLVAGCGGGASENTNEEVKPPVITNSAPVVSIEGQVLVQEMQALNLVAKAHDKESQSLSYTWSHNGNAQITLDGENEANVTIRSTDLTQDTPILLSVTVSDAHGATAVAKHVVTVIDAPVVSVDIQDKTIEQSTFSLYATANSSKAIKSYQWSGHTPDSIEVSGYETDTLVIKTGDLTEDVPLIFDLTVIDETGGQTTVSKSVLIKSFAHQLTIMGKVTDQPIEHAHVQAQIGDKVFTSIANNLGEYALAINLEQSEEAYIHELVKLTATGQGQLDFVEFVSQLGALSQLNLAAGTDAVLNAEELFDVNVTNVTTAEYALLSEFDDAFDSAEQLENRRLGISAKQKLDIATVLKAIVDNDSVDLPESHVTTLDLAKDKEASNQFLSKLKEEQPDLVQSTVDALKSDADLLQPAVLTLEEVLWVTEPDYQNGYYFGLELNDDNTGYYIAEERHKVSWERENNRVLVTFSDPLLLSYSAHMDGYNHLNLKSIILDFYAQNEHYNSATVTFIGDEYGTTQLTPRQFSFHSQIYTKSSFAQLSQHMLDGDWSFLKLGVSQNVYHEYVFDDSGKVIDRQTSNQSEWLISGSELRIKDGESTQILQLIAHSEFGYHLMGHTLENEQITNAYTAYMVKRQDVSFDTFDYQRTWTRLQSTQSSVFNIDEQGVVNFGLSTGRRYVLESGELVSYSYTFNGEGRYDNCEHRELCAVNSVYSYQLLGVAGDRIAVKFTARLFERDYTFEVIRFIDVRDDEGALSSSFNDALLQNTLKLYSEDGSIIDSVNYCHEDEPCALHFRLAKHGDFNFYQFEQRQGYYELTSKLDNSVLYLEVTELGDTRFAICLKSEQSAVCNELNTTTYTATPITYPISVKASDGGRIDLRTASVTIGESVNFRVLADENYYISSLNICGRDYSAQLAKLNSEFFHSETVYDACHIEATFEEILPIYGQHLLYDPSLYLPLLHELDFYPNGKGEYKYTGGVYNSKRVQFDWHTLSEYQSHVELEYASSFVLKNYYNDVFKNTDLYVAINALKFDYLDGKSLSWELEGDLNYYGLTSQIGPVTLNDTADSAVYNVVDWVGKWVFVYQYSDTYYELNLEADGQGTFLAVSDAGVQTHPTELTWEVDESGQLKLSAVGIVQSPYILKPIQQNSGFIQIETQGRHWFDNSEHFKTGVGIMAKAMEESLTLDEVVGKWHFKWGPESNSYHGFVINDDASVDKYTALGNVIVEEDTFTIQYFYDYVKGNYVPSCNNDYTHCSLSHSEQFKVISKQNGMALLASDGGEYHVAQYSKDLHVDHFIPSLIENFTYYFLDGEHYGVGLLSRHHNQVDEYNWSLSSPAMYSQDTVKYIDGKFFHQTSQGAYWIKPVMYVPQGVQVCIYEDGQSCEQGTQQTWLYQAPTFDITLKVGQGGAVNADTTLENVLFGNYIHLTILADEGYRIADFEGCNARFLWEISLSEALIEVAPSVSDCTLTVSFERDSGQSVVDSLGIKDPGLKSCVESQGLSYPQFLAFLNCNSSTIDSFSGIENFKYLLSISLYDTSLSAQAKADLENMTQLKSLHLYDVDYTVLNLSKLNQLTNLSLSQASTVSNIVLPVQSSLYTLDISNSSVTEIDLSNQVKLRSLSVGESALTHLDLSNNLELELLNISGSKVEDISGVTTDHKIQRLNAASSALATLELRNFDDVEVVDLSNTSISLLELGGNAQLHTLNASDTPLARINVEPGQYTLTDLALNNTNLKELELRYFEQLSNLELTSTFLTSLDLTNNQQLFFLEAGHAQLSEVIWSTLPRLFSVNLAANPLTEFIFEQNMVNLHQLDLSNTGIRVLHIPDGATLRSLKFSENQLDNITGVEYLSTVGSTFDLTNTTLSAELLQYIQSHNVSVIH
ncbi:hypothetical protein N473_15240 [Pseudoalteromonas luteoviolacea CPMOR-1]|uniref:Ig-like domain-containing protein n=2 Tax=Pseudoalteromonas luteoviolacea TaxID=43657 RepID=A0A162AZU4_9GAMM|nr:hypothetical protein N473_15240 [Pseudoalteromonas luteoviolacea CPMOR-1]